MTIPLTYNFDDLQGRWVDSDGTIEWDTTEQYDSEKTYLRTASQRHVDLRDFHQNAIGVPRVQSQLDLLTQTQLESSPYQTQTNIETAVKVAGENWAFSGSGFTFSSANVGIQSTYNNWRGLKAVTSSTTVNGTFSSAIAVDANIPATAGIDISQCANLVLTCPDLTFSAFENANSYLTLTSNPTGVVGTSAYDAKVLFSASGVSFLNSAKTLQISIANYAAASSFTPASVTGVALHLQGTVTSGATMTLMGLRAIGSSWVARQTDFDTRTGTAVVPVTLDGGAFPGGVDDIPLIRGSGQASDPKPQDGSYSIFFGTGQTLATSPAYDEVSIIMRELKNTSVPVGSYIQAGVRWNGSTTKVYANYVDTVASTTTAILPLTTISGTLTPGSDTNADVGRYVWTAELVGSELTLTLQTTDSLLNPIAAGATGGGQGSDAVTGTAWSTTVASSVIPLRSGRVGFAKSFTNRDVFIDQFVSTSVGFGLVRTLVFPQYTAVDGAQLTASYSSDSNLFESIYWIRPSEQYDDATKTTSGNGSYRSLSGVFTNQFLIEDWNQTYLDIDIWVGPAVTAANEPRLTLTSQGNTYLLRTGALQANQWNHVHVDFAALQGNPTGFLYSLSVTPADSSLGNFWVDSIMVGKRLVAWQMRATPNGPWRDFYGLVNQRDAALHLPRSERGTQLQLQGIMLDPGSWAASYSLMPHHAEIGNMVFDQSAPAT